MISKHRRMAQCTVCGADIPLKSLTCSKCGTKKKKAFYEQWWFWLVVATVLTGIIAENFGPIL